MGGGTMAKKQNNLFPFPIRVSSEVERLFDEMIHRPWGFCREIRGWNPSVDLYENGDYFLLEADLPGVKLDDVSGNRKWRSGFAWLARLRKTQHSWPLSYDGAIIRAFHPAHEAAGVGQ
jgi:hypothetical protein